MSRFAAVTDFKSLLELRLINNSSAPRNARNASVTGKEVMVAELQGRDGFPSGPRRPAAGGPFPERSLLPTGRWGGPGASGPLRACTPTLEVESWGHELVT